MPKTYTVYDAMTFPEWEQRDYPKHLYTDSPDLSYEKRKSDKYVVVNNEEEERQVRGGAPLVDEDFERSRLLKIVEIKGIQVDGRVKTNKGLRKAIEDAGHDPEQNPFE